jgi:hypothetical protein
MTGLQLDQLTRVCESISDRTLFPPSLWFVLKRLAVGCAVSQREVEHGNFADRNEALIKRLRR